MSKNVAVFVDVANIFYAAKAAGVDIDYVTLLKASSAGRDLVRAYAYTGLDPENENQRNFHDFLRRHGYKVVSKDIRKYGDGKVKANLDIELVVDMMKTARNLDIAIVVSGDGDFAPAIRAVQEMGVRVEVVSFRGNTSSDLIDVADIFTDITQVAKVEKGSSRSGRRVADDDQDLSMTEVPEKQSEGTGDGRRRRGGRTRAGEGAARRERSVRVREERARDDEQPAAASAGEAGLVVLPGEKLSRAGRRGAAKPDAEEVAAITAAEAEGVIDEDEAGASLEGEAGVNGDEAGRRRRRRRGGRGRGRGRGRGEGLPGEERPAEAGEVVEIDELEELPEPTPRRAAFSFGSVWDSQLGVPASGVPAARAGSPDLESEEDLEEPEIPEYLLAERRQREARARGGRGGRGGRGSAYAAAMERERFGSGSTRSRYAEPPRNRDLGGGTGGSRGGGRFDRPERRDRFEAPRSSNGDPWSEVPPEIEAMLRAQLAAGTGPRTASRPNERPGRESASARATSPVTDDASNAAESGEAAATGRRSGSGAPGRGRGSASGATAGGDEAAMASGTAPTGEAPGDAAGTPAATRRRTSSRATKATGSVDAQASGPEANAEGGSSPTSGVEAAKTSSRRRTSTSTAGAATRRSRAATPSGDAATASADEAATATPKPRSTRRKANTAPTAE